MVKNHSSTPVEQLKPTEDISPRGFAEVHDNTGIDMFDISDYMVATIRGEELPTREVEVSTAMGRAATAAVVGWDKLIDHQHNKTAKLDKRLKKLETTEDDTRWAKTKKFLGRRAVLTAFVATSATGIVAALAATRGIELSAVLAADNIDMMPVTHEFGTVIVAGGAGQGNGDVVVPEMDAKQYLDQGYNVETVQYPGEIGPVVGQMSMEDSGNIGAADMYAKAMDDLNAGRETQLIGYSEGSYVALETANRIIAENGGVKPDNLSVTIIGAPYAQGGILGSNNPFANAAGPVLDLMGIPKGEPVPAGTHIVYYDTDFWANSGNQVPTSMLRQLIELGFGGHAIPDPNDPSYTFTDSDGVIHTVYSRNDVILQAIQNQTGLIVADTETANRAINDLFPLDGSKPNVAAFQADLATTLEHQGDPLSVFAAQVVRNLPPGFSALGQAAMDGFNGIAEGGAKLASGDVIGGMQQIMQAIGDIMNALGAIAPQGEGGGGQQVSANTQAQVQQLLSSNITGLLQQTTGTNYSSQINSFMNTFQSVSNGSATASVSASIGGNSDIANQFMNIISNHVSGSASAEASATVNGQDITQPLTSMVDSFLQTSGQSGSVGGQNVLSQVTQPFGDTFNGVFQPNGNTSTPNLGLNIPSFNGQGQQQSLIPGAGSIIPNTSGGQQAAAPNFMPNIPDFGQSSAPTSNPISDIIDKTFHPSEAAPAPALAPVSAPAPASNPIGDIIDKVFHPPEAPAPAPAPIHIDPPAPIEAPAPAPIEIPHFDIPAPAPAPAPAPGPNPISNLLNDIFHAPAAPAPAAPAINLPSLPSAPAPAAPAFEMPKFEMPKLPNVSLPGLTGNPFAK